MVFGEITDVKTVRLKEQESVTVPSGKIWKINASCGGFASSDNGFSYAELYEQGGGSIVAYGRDEQVEQGSNVNSFPYEFFKKENSTLEANFLLGSNEGECIHLSIIEMELIQ